LEAPVFQAEAGHNVLIGAHFVNFGEREKISPHGGEDKHHMGGKLERIIRTTTNPQPKGATQ